jgi:hypothetical protein
LARSSWLDCAIDTLGAARPARLLAAVERVSDVVAGGDEAADRLGVG